MRLRRIVIAFSLLLSQALNAAILGPYTTLTPGTSLFSDNGRYQLVMQGDGNLVYYRQPDMAVRWNSQTQGHPGAWTQMQGDGNLVTYHESSEPHASDVLAFLLNNTPETDTRLSAEARLSLHALFSKKEPLLPSAAGDFGMTDLIRYNQWQRIMLRLESLPNTNLEQVFVEHLKKPGTDPRAVLAYLLSPQGSSTTSPSSDSPSRELFVIADRYARQFPDKPLIGQLSAMAASKPPTRR